MLPSNPMLPHQFAQVLDSNRSFLRTSSVLDGVIQTCHKELKIFFSQMSFLMSGKSRMVYMIVEFKIMVDGRTGTIHTGLVNSRFLANAPVSQVAQAIAPGTPLPKWILRSKPNT
jgi:hypothetical protein